METGNRAKGAVCLPETVRRILGTLLSHGYEAYAVGGCVRDSILGREPQDWDITTSAAPPQVKALFPRTVDTGIQHGTVTVIEGRRGYEVTTYRTDGVYEDGRHPKEVHFVSSLREDLRRRDFTINAMAYNEGDGLVDCFGGIKDLEAGIIRCVGEPAERFGEDALRMLRAVRFAAQLGFSVERRTAGAILEMAGNLQKISAERIQAELTKLLVSPHPEKLLLAWQLGITAVVLPEFDRMMETPQDNPHHSGSVGIHTVRALCCVPAERVLRLAMLLHDVGKPGCRTTDEKGIDHFYGHPQAGEEIADGILRRLKFDNDTRKLAVRLVRWHDASLGEEPRQVRRVLSRVGEDLYPLLLQVKEADLYAQSSYHREDKIRSLELSRRLWQEEKARGACVSLGQLAVSGRDLIEAGMQPGPELGRTLQLLLEKVLEDPGLNNREYLLGLAESLNTSPSNLIR